MPKTISPDIKREIVSLVPALDDRANIVLVHAGEKPASEISTSGYVLHEHMAKSEDYVHLAGFLEGTKTETGRDKVYTVPRRYANRLAGILGRLELPNKPHYNTGSVKQGAATLTDESLMIMYASSVKNLDALDNAIAAARERPSESPGPLNAPLGLAFGFPKINTEYFAKLREIDRDKPDVRISPEGQKLLRFLSFCVERKDEAAVKEALGMAKRYSQCVLALWPELHEEIMKFRF